ncbi:MAG: hypothetical protein RL149_362 [Actinomycetota bacterium]
MIKEIYIRDLGIIREARLPFKAGLNVLTGETGAGKTMVLSALGLLLGERSDAGSVRAGSKQAFVEGLWGVVPEHVAARIAEAGGELEDGEMLTNRSVSTEGKSRAAISGVSVPVGLLSEIGDELVVVHGQSDQIRLKSSAAQREALDAFAAVQDLVAKYRAEFEAWRAAELQLREIQTNKSTNEQELQRLLGELEEIEKLSPKPGEDIELREISNRLMNSEALRQAASVAHVAFASEDDSADVTSLLVQAKRALESQVSSDSSLESLLSRIVELSYQASDVSSEISSYLSSLESDSEYSLDQIQSRRAELNALIKKHGVDLDAVFAFSEQASRRVVELDSSDERIDAVTKEVADRHERVLSLADELSAKRTAAAELLAKEVNHELAGLAMAGAELVVSVEKLESLASHGSDLVSFGLKTYAGAEPRPIGKGASGGELSRIMLALEVVLAKGSSGKTFIFDEVDAGIGGAAAIEVGKRLSRLSKEAQVIVVTHLAQVAAFADNHHMILKSNGSDVTESDVLTLAEADRQTELARMLSGLTESAAALEHAAELMSLAKASSGS